MTSKNTRMKQEIDKLETARRQKFVEAVEALQNEHGYRVVAMMNYNQRGAFAELGIDKQEVKAVV